MTSLLESVHCQKVQFFKHTCWQYSPFTISIVWIALRSGEERSQEQQDSSARRLSRPKI